MKSNKLHFATRTIHSGYDPHQHQGALTPPMHTSSTFAFNSVEQGGAAFAGDNDHYIYSRLGTPSQQQLEPVKILRLPSIWKLICSAAWGNET